MLMRILSLTFWVVTITTVKKMTKQIEIGSTIKAKRSTKWIINGTLYKVIGKQMAFPYYIVRCPYDGMKHYIHQNNMRVVK